MKKTRLPNIKQKIIESYISLERPNYSFVEKAVNDKMYEPITAIISTQFDLEEITDTNYDVCFSYLIKGGDYELSLELSMVGPFFILLRLFNFKKNELISKDDCSSFEKKIISIVERNGLNLLTKEELETPFRMKLMNTESENACIFQSLFADTDFFPWGSE